MGIFGRGAASGLYVSEFEQFLNRLKTDHPEMDRNQMIGRALLWDKLPRLPDSGDVAGKEGALRQPSYVYYSDND
ncbi:DUF3460 family protein [Caballeronia concitans]|uniref:DUF3460 domain-containing protein n=1 Tax=Caballeronia concitans TaxID=1777133 RepID=A0A658QUF1_9BURK|nr:DUF3460 family protein [Caballeronia concitans]KIG07526.1 Protein of unknown function DUF3460 [Burkholderia sp. MR1]SAL22971.1 hypothetical protein AWB72_01650 [Caballeronia concitans]